MQFSMFKSLDSDSLGSWNFYVPDRGVGEQP